MTPNKLQLLELKNKLSSLSLMEIDNKPCLVSEDKDCNLLSVPIEDLLALALATLERGSTMMNSKATGPLDPNRIEHLTVKEYLREPFNGFNTITLETSDGMVELSNVDEVKAVGVNGKEYAVTLDTTLFCQ